MPPELLIKIFRITTAKYQMVEIFPWIKQFIPKCYSCGENSYFLKHHVFNDNCEDCEDHIGGLTEYSCGIKCNKGTKKYKWFVMSKLYQGHDYKFRVEFCNVKGNCYNCKREITYKSIADGYQICKFS